MASMGTSLTALAALLRGENVIAPYVRDPRGDGALGALVAAGTRASAAPEDYAVLIEAIREGYLLHYASARLIDGADPDLRLLAGDYLYALGLERLAARGDLDAVRELADLISLSAQIHAEETPESAQRTAGALWLATAVAVAAGTDPEHARAKDLLRAHDPAATELLLETAARSARRSGLGDALAAAAESIGFAGQDLPNRG